MQKLATDRARRLAFVEFPHFIKCINITEQGHWILPKMGKTVLRPGGKELTLKLVDGPGISSEDAVVEFASEMGYTASLVLNKNPRSYTGIELNEEASQKLKHLVSGTNRKIINANAAGIAMEKIEKF